MNGFNVSCDIKITDASNNISIYENHINYTIDENSPIFEKMIEQINELIS